MLNQVFLLPSDNPVIQSLLESIASRLNLDFVQDLQQATSGSLVMFESSGMLVIKTSGSKINPICVDFVYGKSSHRRKFGGGKNQNIAKAVGLNKGITPSVLDATGGLGQDAFVLASLGCDVTVIERSPIVAALLEDGLRRALEHTDTNPIARRISLKKGDAIDMMNAADKMYDVIYLDPMFPHREKSAEVKKEMKLFQELLGNDPDSSQLLSPALNLAKYRVVVKRPKLAPDLDERPPSYRLKGKVCRYDIYALKAFPG